MIERGLGYHLVHRKNGFYARRDSKGFVPPDGHWRFIVLCAEMAQNKLHITDIEITGVEVNKALREAGWNGTLLFPYWVYDAQAFLRFRDYNKVFPSKV